MRVSVKTKSRQHENSDAGYPGDKQGIARIPGEMVGELLRLRGNANLQGAVDDAGIWLKWLSLDPRTYDSLRAIPRIEFYSREESGAWKRWGNRLPSSVAVPTVWRNFDALLPISLPAAGLGVTQSQPVPLSLSRTDVEKPTGVLVISAYAWLQYAEHAPEIRLSPLRFAANSQGEIVVVGQPAPSIPGSHFYSEQGVAIPAGWKLSPIEDLSIVTELLTLAKGDLALISPVAEEGDDLRDNVPLTVSIITASSFVAATRSAIRATCRLFINK